MTAKTDAQRQADRKVREEAAGNKLYKRWVHPGHFAALDELVAKLEAKRARIAAKTAKAARITQESPAPTEGQKQRGPINR